MLKALIFDVDGTLAETEEAHRAAFNETFKAWGLDWIWSRALYHKLLNVGGSKERIKFYGTSEKPKGYELVLEDDNLLKMHQEKTKHYSELVSSGQVALRPGVARLIEEARSSGLKLGIATTTNITPLEALFEGTLGLKALSWFEAIAAGDMASHKKPAPDLYLLALKQLGLKPNECLAIEDSLNGLDSAVAAGIPTVITLNDYTKDQDFTRALAIMSDLGEPDKPFLPIGGEAKEPDYLTIELAQKWQV